MSIKKTVVRDSCLILFILAIALFLFVLQRTSSRTGTWVVIRVNGTEISRFSILTDGSFSVNGGTNTVNISNGRVSVSDADCPDRLCVKQGYIRFSGQCITCLPNKLTVTVEGGNSPVDSTT